MLSANPVADMEPLTKLVVVAIGLFLMSLPFVAVGMGVVIVMRAVRPPKPKKQRTPIGVGRYVLASCCAATTFLVLLVLGALVVQLIDGLPDLFTSLPLIIQVVIPPAVAVYVFSAVATPTARKPFV